MYTEERNTLAETDRPMRMIEGLGYTAMQILNAQTANREALSVIERNIHGPQPTAESAIGAIASTKESGPSNLPDLADALEQILRREIEINERLLSLKGV